MFRTVSKFSILKGPFCCSLHVLSLRCSSVVDKNSLKYSRTFESTSKSSSQQINLHSSNESTCMSIELSNNSSLFYRHQTKPIDDLIENVRRTDNIEIILNLIEPHLCELSENQLSPNYLEAIYDHINHLCFSLKLKYISHNECRQPLRDIKHTLRSSKVFKSLVDRTLNSEVSDLCLLKVFKTFSLINLKAKNQSLNIIINKLIKKSDQLDSRAIPYFLKTLDLYSKNTELPVDYIDIKRSVLEVARNRTLKDEINDESVMIQMFELFQQNPDFEVLNHLTKLLLTPSTQIDYKQSVRLLANIKNLKEKKFKKANILNQLSLNDKLIDKCNAVIHKHFTQSEPQIESVSFYCSKLHNKIDRLPDQHVDDIDNLYDPDILKSIVPYTNFYTYNVVTNHAKFCIYDERLLKKIYDLTCEVDRFKFTNGIYTYLTLSELDLPFIYYQHLASILFDQCYRQIVDFTANRKTDALQFVCKLILNDFEDKRLLFCLDDLLRFRVERLRLDSLFEILNLTKVYLSIDGQINEDLLLIQKQTKNDQKFEIISKFDQMYLKTQLTHSKPKIYNEKYYQHRLQENAYLSNGLHLKTIAIYDQSIDDLVPLTNFKDYLHQIDKAPLNENELLITFIYRPDLRGNIGPYDTLYNSRLKEILNQFNIKQIEVSNFFMGENSKISSDIKEQPIEKQIVFLTKKALESYESKRFQKDEFDSSSDPVECQKEK